jgi:hypothetical protein
MTKSRQACSYSRCMASEVCQATDRTPPGEREAERRQAQSSRWPRRQTRQRADRRALASRRSTAVSPRRRTPGLSPGHASRNEVRRRYLRLWIALKRSTSRTGHCAGRVDARTARERSANPPAGTALAPHPKVPSRRRPSLSEMKHRNQNGDTSQEIVSVIVTKRLRRFIETRGRKRPNFCGAAE